MPPRSEEGEGLQLPVLLEWILGEFLCAWAVDPNVWGSSWALERNCFCPVRDLSIEFLTNPIFCSSHCLPRAASAKGDAAKIFRELQRKLGCVWVFLNSFFGLLCVGFGASGFFSCGNSSCMEIFWIKPARAGGIGWIFVINKWKLLPVFCVQLFWTALLSSCCLGKRAK